MVTNDLPGTRIHEMFDALASASPETQPSKYWSQLNDQNVEQLDQFGYQNFKQTVALNYFTWAMTLGRGIRDSQLRFLVKHLSVLNTLNFARKAFIAPKHSFIPLQGSIYYNFITYALWTYSLRVNPYLAQLSEPEEGNPPRVFQANKLISQDLANSALEYAAITDAIPDMTGVKTIVELGAGYGRTAYVFLKLLPNIRYIIADIPPALYVSERYLSSQFPDRRIFKFRDFKSYSEIEKEFQESQIAFLLPHQLEFLPDKSADLFINISSLHEMRLEQIKYYLNVADRLTSQYFYMKQWIEWRNPADNFVIRENDYPIPETWSQMYWRKCAVQTYFFETLHRL
jgi:putative sugar O-methyltransferase